LSLVAAVVVTAAVLVLAAELAVIELLSQAEQK
jgi:hypothetical protein